MSILIFITLMLESFDKTTKQALYGTNMVFQKFQQLVKVIILSRIMHPGLCFTMVEASE